MKKPYKLISDRMSLRSYRVRAYLNPKTGRVIKIKAGCRTWHSIAEAVAHYAGHGKGRQWNSFTYWDNLDAEAFNGKDIWGRSTVRTPKDMPVCQRNDALLTVARLAAHILRYQKRCRS